MSCAASFGAQRKLVLTMDAGGVINGQALAEEYVALSGRPADLQATVGFASRGSPPPTRLAEGLPVIAPNVDAVNVEFLIKDDVLPGFLSQRAFQQPGPGRCASCCRWPSWSTEAAST